MSKTLWFRQTNNDNNIYSISMNNNNYRYQLERYRGRGSRYTCPQCHRKQSFTRYIDTYNNNIYINDNVGKCNRLDKCGYHYTPKQYFTDNPWKEERLFVCRNHRVFDKQTMTKPQPTTITPLPRWFMEQGFLNRVGAEAP